MPLGQRQINRHLARFAANLAAIDQAVDSDSDSGSDLAPDVGNAANDGGDVLMDIGRDMDDDALAGPVQGIAEMDLGDQPVPIRRNPPVTIEELPDPEGDFSHLDDVSYHLSDDEEPIDGPDRDPPFVEPGDEALGAHPEDEGLMDDAVLRAFLEMNLGDYAEEEWFDLYNRVLSEKDHRTLQFLAARLRTHFLRQTWEDLRHGACEEMNLPSDFVAWRRLRTLSGLESRSYNCCINSCICFLGRHADLNACPICDEPRLNSAGNPRRSFRYTPLIPQLRALFRNPSMLEKLRYCVMAEDLYRPGVIEAIFDSENYRQLRATLLYESDNYHFFDNPTDIALGLLTDGFTARVRLENLICVGVIPGPKQCKDINSFLPPLLEELLELEKGVLSVQISPNDDPADFDPDAPGLHFILRAFLIVLFGDIPAVSKLLRMKGHNAKTPCRMCYIQGTLCRLARNSVYYVPLTPPDADEAVLAESLLLRTHDSFLAHYAAMEQAGLDRAAQQELTQLFGLNARPVFTRLKSLDLATCAPYDAMHLLFENLVPNMIRHWLGEFKGLDQGTGNYEISKDDWREIGRLTANAARTIPSYFVGTLPDIAQDRCLYKAEAYSFWFQYLAPILLEGRLQDQYYEHFLLMREIIIRALQFEITHDELDELEHMVNQWVSEYKQYYYQYETTRLPTCPLTIYALLHMARTIRKAGPLWTSWAFVMERFCGHLVPAVKNCTRPHDHLDNYIQRRAQIQIVSLKYNLPSLAKPRINYTLAHGEKISSHEKVYAEFPTVVLGTPVSRNVQVTVQLTNQLTKYFGTVYYEMRLPGAGLRARIDFNTLVLYGRFRLAGGGDSIRTASSIDDHPDQGARDNSFVRYDLLPDANARYRNLPEVQVRRTHYGRVLDVFYVEFIVDRENPDDTREPYLLARIWECQTGGLDATLPESPLVTYRRISTPDIVHIESINAAIGRIYVGNNTWAIIDRSRNGARTQFVEEGPDYD